MCSEKVGSGYILGKIRGPKVWMGSVEFQIRFCDPEKKRTGVSDLLSGLKCSKSYSEALETLISLPA